ncbi:hypothetical protein ATE92_2795 [Ulvibacter sp. MAR_2010_11]|uniref:hypothetical protein n=1 Tax=Ulvibacter sp. MAR_2010_11 TaxID=1250229 RepID=UPI000C2BBEE1|nr:hypothetical protein [Ulvibacter sp. MAR_2010_11]PKA84597.1 hypothetical protein ATE92_2795 [Ulvibacter sp. MAR_2010_11]
MRHTITLFSLVLLLVACNSVKRNQKLLAKGDYDKAIDLAVKKIQKDKNSDKNDAHIVLLEEAFKKAAEDDTRRITFLKKENNPSGTREIYHLYRDLEYRQDLIRPLLPLYSSSLGRTASFKLVDYTGDLIASKKAFTEYLYTEANRYMTRQTTADYRTAYNIYCEIDELQPNYKDVKKKKDDAHFFGTDFIFVTLNNRSGQMIPFRLERELLDFNTYGLDDFWTEYHAERQQNIQYNYGISLNFRDIGMSPERISEKEVLRKKTIKTGWDYKRDRNGAIVNDSLGNPIKIDKFETVTARLHITEQTKSVLVAGNVVYRDLIARRDLNNYPLSSEFIFENVFATYHGDKRALDPEDWNWVNNRYVHFPSYEQMVLDAGDDIKIRLKEILKNNSIR